MFDPVIEFDFSIRCFAVCFKKIPQCFWVFVLTKCAASESLLLRSVAFLYVYV